MELFEGVVPALASALANRGYENLTPVQIAVLGPEMSGSDLLKRFVFDVNRFGIHMA